MIRKFYLFLFGLFFTSHILLAQSGNNKLIDVNFNQATITQFVTDIEAKTGYHFYYDPAQLDSLRITLDVKQKSLKDILELSLQKTPYNFFITQHHEVLLSKNHTFQSIATTNNTNTKQGNPTTDLAKNNYDYTDTVVTQKVIGATLENKLYEIGTPGNNKSGNATLAGYLRDFKSGEPVIGASIYVADLKKGAATDNFGFYSITLPKGRRTLIIKGLGLKDTRRQIMLNGDGRLDVNMQENVATLKEVKISGEKVANVRSVEMGVTKIDIKSIKQVPTVFGEADVLRAVLTLPGVQTVGEASTGFNVRGGSADQNLILLNDATIYNPSHFFGFFSAFNPDIVQSVELYKSSIPEKFGGRLSSVLEVTNREGNKKKFTGSAGIGLLTSRLYIEGPIDSNRTSFIFGGRATYADWLLSLLPPAYKNSSASFYDVNLDISHKIDDKNNLYLTTYFSNDNFRLNSDTNYKYGNRNISLKWKHNYNNKLYSTITGGFDRYEYSITSQADPLNAYNFGFNINQTNFKTDFTYYLSPKHTITFGLSSIYYKLNPGSEEPLNSTSLTTPVSVEGEQALESALYLGDKFDITPDFSVSAGIRYSLYNYLGPQTVHDYLPNQPKTVANQTDSVTYGKNKVINTYQGPEIRLSARYILSDDLSLKGSYNTLRQYIHLLSNSTAISPTDVWKLSDPNIKPETGSQISLGIYKNLSSNTIETSVEVYYKTLKDVLDYKSGAVLVLNQHIETDVLNTQGKAYGAEFLVKKATGQLNGWISYTYSRTFLRQDDPNAGELINNGNYYPANYDKPHNFNFTGNYRFTHRYSMSLNVLYSTGRPITYPIGKYNYGGVDRVLYSDRNLYRIPDYFRSDIAVNIEGNHKVHQFFHNSWTVGVYNLTGRHNSYSTYFTEQGGNVNGYNLSIFANPIPFINYNIRF